MAARLTITEFETRLPETLKLLGTYRGMRTKVQLECLSCGLVFAATPGAVLRTGCTHCNLNERRLHRGPREAVTHELFLTRLEGRGIEVLGTYQGARLPVSCECQACHHQWAPLAMNLYRSGCPACAAKRTQVQRQRDHTAFMDLMVDRPVLILSQYRDSRTQVRFVCTCCWKIQRRRADHLIAAADRACTACHRPRVLRVERLRQKRIYAKRRYWTHREEILQRQRERRAEGDSYNRWQRRHRAKLKRLQIAGARPSRR